MFRCRGCIQEQPRLTDPRDKEVDISIAIEIARTQGQIYPDRLTVDDAA